MWSSISALLTLGVMVFKLWADNEVAKEAKFNAEKQAIHDAVESGDHARIHAIIDGMRR